MIFLTYIPNAKFSLKSRHNERWHTETEKIILTICYNQSYMVMFILKTWLVTLLDWTLLKNAAMEEGGSCMCVKISGFLLQTELWFEAHKLIGEGTAIFKCELHFKKNANRKGYGHIYRLPRRAPTSSSDTTKVKWFGVCLRGTTESQKHRSGDRIPAGQQGGLV